MALTLNVARDISGLWYRQLAHGEVIRKEACNGLLLTGKTIGVIGMGHIGRQIARMFKGAFGTRTIAYDPFAPEGAWADFDHERVHDLDDLLFNADVVSVHVPLTPETSSMIGYSQMQKMKWTAILINASWGGIVDEADLQRALDEKLIWGCGFDCHVQEPPTLEKYGELWSYKHYVGTPHVAAATDETQIATTNAAIDFVYQHMVEASKRAHMSRKLSV